MPAHDLSKIDTAKVTLSVDKEGHRVIENCPASDVEFAFYQCVANSFDKVKITSSRQLPANLSSRNEVPYSVERETVANDDALSILVRLHRYSPTHDRFIVLSQGQNQRLN